MWYSLGSVVIVTLNLLEFKVDKVRRVKRAGLLELHRFYSGSQGIEVGVGTQSDCPSTDQVEPEV